MFTINSKALCITAVLLSALAVYAMPAASRITLPSGKKIFVSGMNLAWIQYAGDVGDTPLNETRVNQAMKAISDSGGNCIRIWLSTDGTNDPKYGADGLVTGPGSQTITNIQKMLQLAKNNNLLLMPVLLTHNWVNKSINAAILANNKKMLTTDAGLQAYIDNYLIPVVTAIGNDPNLICWEVYNEPEGMVQGWSSPANTITKEQVQKSVNRIAAAIREAVPEVLISNGAATIGTLTWYTDAALAAAGGKTNGTLDFYMAHYYGWNGTTNSPFTKQYASLNLDKPLIIGEYASSDWSTSTPSSNPMQDGGKVDTLLTYLDNAGYAGGLGWQYQQDGGDPWMKGFATFGHSLMEVFRADSNAIKLTGTSDNTFLVMGSAGIGGTVTVSVTGRVNPGTSVTLTAVALSGYTFSSWTGDTTSTEAILVIQNVVKDWSLKATFTPGAGTNLIEGGDFSDETKWTFYADAQNGNDASISYENGQADVTIMEADTLNYHIQLSQGGITLDSGVTYTVTFDAWSSEARDLIIGLSTAETWHWQGGGFITLTDARTRYTVDITPDSSTTAGILQFNCGASILPVHIDEVTFVKKNTSPAIIHRTYRETRSGLIVQPVSSSAFRFSFEKGNCTINRLSVYRADGTKILSINSNQGIIDYRRWASGVYLINVTNGTMTFSRPILVY